MEERIELTEQDLIEAVLQAQADQGPAGALTIRDLVKRTGRTDTTIRTKLHELREAGRLEVLQVRRATLDGRVQPVPAYRLKCG